MGGVAGGREGVKCWVRHSFWRTLFLFFFHIHSLLHLFVSPSLYGTQGSSGFTFKPRCSLCTSDSYDWSGKRSQHVKKWRDSEQCDVDASPNLFWLVTGYRERFGWRNLAFILETLDRRFQLQEPSLYNIYIESRTFRRYQCHAILVFMRQHLCHSFLSHPSLKFNVNVHTEYIP